MSRARARGSLPRHALRVAAVVALVIAAAFVAVSITFDLVDSRHLVEAVDSGLREHLQEVLRTGVTAPAPALTDSDHDVDAAPVLVWFVSADGTVGNHSEGAPSLPPDAWSRGDAPVTTRVGSTSFRLLAGRRGQQWVVVGQSLAATERVEHVVAAAEAIAGPVVVLASFLGALVIGIQASRPVEDARRRQLEFTSDASHELRTPLSVIEAEVSLALHTPRAAADYRRTLERVGAESQRLHRIIEDLLWLARFDSQPSAPPPESVDLAAVARSGTARFAAVAGTRDTVLTLEQEGDGPFTVLGPRDWFDRLVAVLVDNACRYAGPRGTVRVSVGAHGSRAVLAVEDSGPGIPPPERPRLFDRFHRLHDDDSGTGLGLAIADSVVRSTGGRWNVGDSTLGGARMEVTFPRAGARDTDQRAPELPAPEPAPR